MQHVFVLDRNKRSLMPCPPARARQLLRRGRAMDVDVSGVKALELEVGNEARWHNAASSVNWANLRLERK